MAGSCCTPSSARSTRAWARSRSSRAASSSASSCPPPLPAAISAKITALVSPPPSLRRSAPTRSPTPRPPFFHRNVMSEFMGLVHGAYDAKAEGFMPGGMSLHNCLSAHGPDRATFEKAVAADLKPQRIADTLAFMFETRLVVRPTRFALDTPALQADYDACWAGFAKTFERYN